MSHAHPKIPETWESRSSPYYRSDMDKDSEYYIPKSVRQSWRLLRPSLQDVGVPVPARKNPKESWQNVKKTKFGMPLEFSPAEPTGVHINESRRGDRVISLVQCSTRNSSRKLTKYIILTECRILKNIVCF